MELLESTLKELEVRERAHQSLEDYYVKNLCPNFKERFKNFQIHDIDSYENYNLQNILDDLRHIQILLQSSPSKTSFKQKREFLVQLSQEMLAEVKKRAGIKPVINTEKKPAPPVRRNSKTKEAEVKLPPLNPKAEFSDKTLQKQENNNVAKKVIPKNEAGKNEALNKITSSQEKPHKTVSLPEIAEIEDDGAGRQKPHLEIKDPAAFIESLQLTAEQEDMLQKTLKKHGLKPEIWTNYLETKLNHYSNFNPEWNKKQSDKLDLHIEIAKFEQEYERFVLRKNRTLRSINFGGSQTMMSNGSLTSRAKSVLDESRMLDSNTYNGSILRTEMDLDLRSKVMPGQSMDHLIHMTPKKRFMSFRPFDLSQTPQKRDLSLNPQDENAENPQVRRREQLLSLDLTATPRRSKISPVLAFNLSPIQKLPNNETNEELKNIQSPNSRTSGTIKKNYGLSSTGEPESEEWRNIKRNLKLSNVNTMKTVDSAIMSSASQIHRIESSRTINDVSIVHESQIYNRRRPNGVNGHQVQISPWVDSSDSVSLKTTNSTKTMLTIKSQNLSFKLSQLRSPDSEIKVSDILELEYASEVKRIHLLGAGSEAKVFLCQIKEFEEIVVLKQYELVKNKQSSLKSYESLKKEFQMLRQLNHDNVIRYLSLYKPRKMSYSNCIEFGIIMEYLSGGSLEAYIDSEFDQITFKAKKFMMRQLVEGLDHLHEHNIIHRDLKPGNIVLSEDKSNLKLTDFGISIKTDGDTTAKRTWVGTPWYMAPEVINHETYSSKADIWSVGCCFIHLLTGKKPYHNANAMQALMLMINYKSPLEYYEKEALEELYQQKGVKELLEACFIRDKSSRPTAKQLLAFPFFSDDD